MSERGTGEGERQEAWRKRVMTGKGQAVREHALQRARRVLTGASIRNVFDNVVAS